MGCVFTKKNKVEIKVADIIDKGEKNYLRLKGKLIWRMDSIYNVPKIDGLFDNWYTNSMKLWPKTEKAREYFLGIERTPINSSNFSGSSGISLDKIH